ncbi:hypothetical protein BGX26_005203 [Mortierella sp. AD094]|nr:hypothetical protein BGX26_005203 [Mortierella sp. AD094]
MSAYITFPCEDKRPCVTGWNVLEKSVPHEESQNHGILCGLVNNLTVIDFDLIKDKENKECPDKYMCSVGAWNVLSKFLDDKTKVPTVRTKNGGLHLYFRYNAALPSGIQRISGAFFGCPGKVVKIDVLSNNKYVIGPGSTGYTFIEGKEWFNSPPDLPDEIVQILAPAPHLPKKGSPIKVDTVEPNENASEDADAKCARQPVEKKLLKSVVEAIPDSFADNYQDWLRVVWAIADTAAKNKYDALDIADEFSRRSAKYRDRADVEKMSEYKFLESEDDDLESVNTEVLISDLKVFEELGHATSVKRIVENKDAKVISLGLDDGSNKDIWVYKNNLVVSGDKDFIGYARNKVCVDDKDLSVVHPEFGDGPSSCPLKDKDTIEFVYKAEKNGSIEHRIRVKHPWDSKDRYCVKFSNSKRVGGMVSSKKAIDVLINALASGSHQVFKDRYNINIYNNGRDVVHSYGTSKESEYEFIEDLLIAHPGIVDFFKFFGLTEQETKFINTHSNIQQLRKMFVKKIYDDEFGDRIDENRDVFAVLNGIFDLKLGTLRRTNPQDYAMTCAGWKYCKNKSAKHMDDVVDFFAKILPIKEERLVVLTFIASMLHGYRVDKKFLVLTDKRSGNNGKSTLLALLREFFDKDSHDAGLEPLKGKRIVLADELKKSMRLDDALIKSLAGGHYVVEGRRIGRIIMVFNEGDCPTFDPSDTAFMERMLVCPMRSKFVVCDQDDEDSYTYKIDPTIHEEFPSWRSSLLDYLIQHCSKSGLVGMGIPAAMKEWKDEIVIGNNEIAEWLLEHTELAEGDFMSLSELRDLYIGSAGHHTRLSNKGFNSAAKALFEPLEPLEPPKSRIL